MAQPKFDGRCTIRVRFRSRTEYEKFRKYILKTKWSYDLDYPMWEELVMDFHNTEDVEQINKHVIGLLQMGFEVYCCRFKMEEQLAEEEHPEEEDPADDTISLEDFDLKKFTSDLWKKLKGDGTPYENTN